MSKYSTRSCRMGLAACLWLLLETVAAAPAGCPQPARPEREPGIGVPGAATSSRRESLRLVPAAEGRLLLLLRPSKLPEPAKAFNTTDLLFFTRVQGGGLQSWRAGLPSKLRLQIGSQSEKARRRNGVYRLAGAKAGLGGGLATVGETLVFRRRKKVLTFEGVAAGLAAVTAGKCASPFSAQLETESGELRMLPASACQGPLRLTPLLSFEDKSDPWNSLTWGMTAVALQQDPSGSWRRNVSESVLSLAEWRIGWLLLSQLELRPPSSASVRWHQPALAAGSPGARVLESWEEKRGRSGPLVQGLRTLLGAFDAQSELNRVAAAIRWKGIPRIGLHLRERGDRSLRLARTLPALPLLRERRHLRPRGGGFFDDRSGSLIFRFRLGDSTSAAAAYSARGDLLLVLDRNGDRLADAVAGWDAADARAWLLVGPDWEAFLECFRERLDALESVSQSDVSSAVIACAAGSGGESGGPAAGGLLTDFGEPDCDETAGRPGPPRAVTEPEDPESLKDVARRYEQRARELRSMEDPRVQRVAELYEQAAENARNLDRSIDRVLQRLEELAQAEMEFERSGPSEAAAQSLREAQDNLARELEKAARLSLDYDDYRDGLEVQEESLGHPRRSGRFPDPENPSAGQPEDPRCGQAAVDSARGTLFTNRRFCAGADLIACLLRETDPISAFTRGVCRTETGPDDTETIVCRRRDEPAPTPEGPGGPGSNPVDAPARLPLPRGVRLDRGFLSTTDLGPLLLVLCRGDGPLCPGQAP